MVDFYTNIPALPPSASPPSTLPPTIVQQSAGFSPLAVPPAISLQINPAAAQSRPSDAVTTHEYVNSAGAPPQITGPNG